ncbi:MULTISPECIES: carbamate kinase [Thermomonosporaceae]|uniref:carbamate kinase n=1 Tax=Thermomonosporaceae TaxID=2012 RepID=UPI00255A7860|nr:MULTISPECIES: carbamate kinase [Thermomonosporaceae]MDL4771048.1 carbamate kinase [Actinomadura xylanilytica]
MNSGGGAGPVLIALGGNAMTGADGSASAAAQAAAVQGAMEHVAELVAAGARVALTHGNGPQVGNLLIKNQLAAHVVPPVPLDWCGAQTQATVGVLIMNALERALAARGAARPVSTVVTRTLVDPSDRGFADPVKPVGRYFPADEARRSMALGQSWRSFGDRGWRRVVASPEPLEILDADAAALLLAAGHVVVAAGGGGVPVVRENGALRGVEAVVDKDLAAQLLARRLGAATLVIATDVEHVMVGYRTPGERPLRRVTVAELGALAAAGHFAGGSMGPKVEAVRRFVAAGGARAAITSLHRIGDAARGAAGTVVEE